MANQQAANEIAQNAGNDVRDSLRSFLGRSIWSDTVSNLVAALVAASVTLVVAILGAVFRVGADLVALFLTSLEEGRRQNFEAINNLIAAAMGDLFGIDINPADLPTGDNARNQKARVEQLGAAVHDLFITSFGGSSGGDIGPGERAARAFTGFNLSYAANAALTGIIPEIESLGFFKEFALIGEEIGGAMALGRMHRRVIAPLFDGLVITPFKQELSAKYPKELLPIATLCTLHNGRLLDDSEFQRQMSAHGMDAAQIERLSLAHAKQIPLPMLERAISANLVTKDIALQTLQMQGFTPEAAELMLQSASLQRQDTLRSDLVTDAFSMAKARFMDATEFANILRDAQVPSDEVTLWTQRLSMYLDHAHKRLTIQEILYLLEHNQITSEYLHTWAVGEGLSEDDAFTLEVWADLKDADAAAKAKAAADKKKAADAKAKAKADAAAAKAGGGAVPGA